jgi:hypothetical protein
MAVGQEPAQHTMPMPADDSTWWFMQDGVVYGLFNHQGDLRAPVMVTTAAGRTRSRRSPPA